MSLPITLYDGEVALRADETSPNGISMIDGGFGTVDSIASTGVSRAVVGNFVGYRKSDYVTQISYGGQSYLIILDSSIIYKEILPP